MNIILENEVTDQIGDKYILLEFRKSKHITSTTDQDTKAVGHNDRVYEDQFKQAYQEGFQAAKNCSQLVPLCHPLMLTSVSVDFEIDIRNNKINIMTECRVNGATGVEMEALTAASVAGLTIYDMCKAVDKEMSIGPFFLKEKSGGKSGHFIREES